MSFALSSNRLERLGAALRVVLAPAGEGGPERWYREVVDAACKLVDADVGSLLGPPAERRVLHSTANPQMVRAYEEYYGAHDLGNREILRRRLEVGHLALVEHVDQRVRSEFYTGYVVPNGLKDMICLNTFTRSGPSFRLVLSYLRAPVPPPDVERNAALLQALAPGFRAGAEAVRVWAGDAGRLGSVLDGLPGALALCGGDGSVVHRNPALAELLAADPEGERVMLEVRSVALAVARQHRELAAQMDAVPGEIEVRTAAGRYTVRGTLAEEGVLGPRALVVVSVRAAGPRSVPDERLRERFGLTDREVEVARCLAQGLSNAELARRLVISPHTARHHTENVMQKLGVTARARVAGLLSGAEPE